MSCIFCTHYKGLNQECEKGIYIENTYESFDCQHYNYNQGLNTD